MIGMVLAAGAGRRLRPYTDTLPKALVPVETGSGDDDSNAGGAGGGDSRHGRTILDIALSNLAAVGLTDIVIVVGYCADAVERRKAGFERQYGVSLTLVHNDKAEEWNNAYSLWLAREYFSKGVLMVNGDTVHPVNVEKTLLSSRGPDILLAVDTVKTLADEEMKVTLSESGHLARITKQMDPATAYGEYIGATLIEPAAADALADSLHATWKGDPDLYYEDGYQELVNRGGKIGVAPIGALDWVEVDNHSDLEKARRIAGTC